MTLKEYYAEPEAGDICVNLEQDDYMASGWKENEGALPFRLIHVKNPEGDFFKYPYVQFENTSQLFSTEPAAPEKPHEPSIFHIPIEGREPTPLEASETQNLIQ